MNDGQSVSQPLPPSAFGLQFSVRLIDEVVNESSDHSLTHNHAWFIVKKKLLGGRGPVVSGQSSRGQWSRS